MTHTKVTTDLRECIRVCEECHRVCTEIISYCLEKGGEHAEADHIRLLVDCAEICQTSANFMLRGSDLHTETCRTCALVCQRCAENCDRMTNDAEMKRCAEVCRRCADSCERMAGEGR